MTAEVSRIGEGISASVTAMDRASVELKRIGNEIKASASRMGEGLSLAASRVGEGIKATVSIICTLSEFVAFLNVSPEEVQWITDDIGVFYEVESNVEWIVLTS